MKNPMTREARRRLIAELEDDEDQKADRSREQLMVDAAKAISEAVVKARKPMTLKQVKEKFLPRSSWEYFAKLMLLGHKKGAIVLSRTDLNQLPGRKPEETGEIDFGGSRFNYVNPVAQPSWKGPPVFD